MPRFARLGCLLFLVGGAGGTWFLVSRGERQEAGMRLPNLTGADGGGLALPRAIVSLLGTSLPSQPEASSVPSARTTKAPSSDDLTLLVSIADGQKRSQILVDGAPVGQAPYLGQLVCRRGMTLTIDLVREDGTTTRHQRPCTGSALEIR
jgi:hypothetical protein